jgi:hypothetical protein
MSSDTEQGQWFIATICQEERSLAYLRVRAKSEEEAVEKAHECISDEEDEHDYYWDSVYADITVDWVEPDDGKRSYGISRVVGQDGEGVANE